MNPDVDDTTASLRAISYLATKDSTVLDAWNRGLQWVISMQNDDGGWAAFEKNTDKAFLAMLPYAGSDRVIDPSSADLTGRTLEFLGNYTNLNHLDSRIQKGIQWLLEHQETDGSWYGRWGISYIYGTWAAITGMKATGVASNHPSIQKVVQWLERIQNVDGGWGESCKSDILKQYVPLGSSTPSQTAWAVDTLVSVFKEPTPSIKRGVQFLIEAGQKQDWTTTYPTGAGLPGGFYIQYHSYKYIWPLLALAHYMKIMAGKES
jgi:sporulenol synthase